MGRRLGIERFKLAAACSLVQQPCDGGHCFMLLHSYFNSAKYKYGDDEGRLSTHMRKVKNTLQNSGMDGPSFKTYWKFLCHF